MLNLIS